MHLAYDEQHDAFRDSLRGMLAQHAPAQAVRAALATQGHDDELWRMLCNQMALPGLRVPQEWGGEGFGLIETCIGLYEVGRALAPAPLLATAMAVEAIVTLGTPAQCAELLPSVLSGEQVATLAVAGPAAFSRGAATVRASGPGELDGSVSHVIHGGVADLVIVPATSADGAVELYAVAGGRAGVAASPQPSLDLLRPLTQLNFSAAPALRLGEGTTADQLARLHDVLRILIAADILGAAAQCLSATVEYVTTRTQFNRPVGSFQAVKHRCAEMAVELDAAHAALLFASLCAADRRPELALAAPVCKAQAAETFVLCATSAVQLLGGIGFTWEHDAHLYLRRAKSAQVLWGASADELRRSARLAGILD